MKARPCFTSPASRARMISATTLRNFRIIPD
jgi:hypothetical protein